MKPFDSLRNYQRFRSEYAEPFDSLRNYQRFGSDCTKPFDSLRNLHEVSVHEYETY